MKYHGKIGFEHELTETSPGIWEPAVVTEREYSGDLLEFSRRTQNAAKVNEDMTLSNQISIIADAYLNENLYAIRYITFMGSKWKIDSVKVEYPRLILSLGGLYNGNTP